jgi:hypothetical protein
MADEINKYPKGTVSHLYITTDGGWKFDDLYDMVDLLDDHVEITNHQNLIEMALKSVAPSEFTH